jgi:quercetin dioxygenase-like cupin family protein
MARFTAHRNLREPRRLRLRLRREVGEPDDGITDTTTIRGSVTRARKRSTMRTTVFERDGEQVRARVTPSPEWERFDEYDGEPLDRVRLSEFLQVPGAEFQLVEIAAGGHFVMHSSPDVAFCQVVRGKGKLGLPDGSALDYQGPELYVFLPDTLHDWHDIEEDTLLSVCLIRHRGGVG